MKASELLNFLKIVSPLKYHYPYNDTENCYTNQSHKQNVHVWNGGLSQLGNTGLSYNLILTIKFDMKSNLIQNYIQLG